MTEDKTIAALEGRLLAHRRVLAQILAILPDRDRETLSEWLEERQILQDGQEDPGAVPAEGLALELSMMEEYQHLAELAKGLRTSR